METNPVVTSVGNSWVVCRSKSHPGRIYYFNTFTGEAAWNLSEVEKEKAKKATKIIEKSGVNMDECPEPKDPPQDCPRRHLPSNKQVQQLHNCQNSGTTKICNNKTSDDAVFVSVCHRVHCCNHSKSLCHNGLISPRSSDFKSNIWNGPVTQQVLLSRHISTLVNQPQCNIDVDHNKLVTNDVTYVQTTSLPMHERFEKYTNDFHSKGSIRARIKKFAKYLKWGVVPRNNLGLKNNLYDVPYAKSCANINNHANYHRQIHNDSRLLGGQYSDNSENTDTISCGQEDKSNLHNQQGTNEDTLLAKKLNMSRLENAKRLFDKNSWCIISDTNNYLHHHGFMKILLEFDEECRLLVLDNVVEDIRNASRSDDVPTMNLGRRAISFISCNIRAGTAVIVKDDTVENNTGMTYILHCCRKYLRESYHILFLCSDREVYNREKGYSFPIYTVDELTSLLQCGTAEESNSKTFQQTPELRITVIINEDENAEDIRKVSKSLSIGIQTSDSDLDKNRPKERVGVGVQTTAEVGTQTPIEFIKSYQTICHGCQSQTTLNSSTSEKQDTVAVVKRKDVNVKLNRNLCNQSPKKRDADKKHYQWRRRRPVGRVENTNISPVEEIMSNKDLRDDVETINTAKKPKLVNSLENRSDIISTESDMVAAKGNRNNCDNNVVLEEISTSGAVSNETGNLDWESSSETSEPIVVIDIQSENYKNFLFEVTGRAMEENLKTRCDEWVSRFLQIMEEGLKQLLPKYTSPPPSPSSPPSTLSEAMQCIKAKYVADVDIVDGADKLSGILLNCSDRRGNIDIHMSPDKYMQMYSCGAYLIDSLKSVNDNSEDLQTAAESLAKLLKDIQNPKGENDTSQVVALDEDTPTKTNEEAELDKSVDIYESATRSPIILQEQPNEKASTPRKYNLRSQWKRTFQNDLLIPSCPDTKVRFFRDEDTESTFFSSLSLKKNDENERAKATDTASAFASRQSMTNAEGSDRNSIDDCLASDKPQGTGAAPSEPRIIRNFTKHKDYENRLKKISPDQTVFEESNKSNGAQIDYMDDEIDNNDENENDEVTTVRSDDENESSDESQSSDEGSDDGSDTDSPSGNNPLRTFMANVLREIRETFLVMYAFCEESQKRLTGPDAKRDSEIIINKAKETHSTIIKLYDALQSINNRDVKETEQNIANFLKSEQVDDFTINEQDFQEYRTIIERCLYQANVIRDTVECIMRQEC